MSIRVVVKTFGT